MSLYDVFRADHLVLANQLACSSLGKKDYFIWVLEIKLRFYVSTVVLYKLSHLSNLPHFFIFLLSSLIGSLSDCKIVIVVYKNVTCKYEHTQRTLMSETRLAWVPAWFLLMGNIKLLEILLSKVRFWNKELKQCYPTALLGFTLETSLTCHRPLIGRFTLRGRTEQFDTTSDRYWAACEVPSCIHGVLFRSFSSSQQHWCHKQTTRCTSEASSGR